MKLWGKLAKITPDEQSVFERFEKLGRICACARNLRTRACTLMVKLNNPDSKFNFVSVSGLSSKYVAVCATHRQSANFPAIKKAEDMMHDPEFFCWKCAEYTSGKGLRLD